VAGVTDTKVLADALRGATGPEMLRGWAAIAVARDANDREDLARMGAAPSTNAANNAFLGLAALALAVAEAQEVTDVEVEKCGGNVFLWRAGVTTNHASIHAALAALLEGGR